MQMGSIVYLKFLGPTQEMNSLLSKLTFGTSASLLALPFGTNTNALSTALNLFYCIALTNKNKGTV